MSYGAVRELFERVHALPAAQRPAYYREHDVTAELAAEVEALLRTTQDDPIPALIGRFAERTLEDTLPPRIGPWRVLDLLGEGGMGVVLRGERADGAFEMVVAIKLIRGYVSTGMHERFRRERQVLAALKHPDIAGLIDGGNTATGEPYLVMPFVDGETLPQWLAHAAPSLRQRLDLFVRLCRAVHHAHQRLVVHRDLKPSNVMVRRDGTPVLLDFGIAKLLDDSQDATATATRALTPAYASPEQRDGRPVTTATDVYGLGLILYELLAGTVPVRGDPQRASDELPPPSLAAAASALPALRAEAGRVRGDLDRIVRRAVRSDPEQRYPTALALAEDVEAFLDGRPVRAAGAQSFVYLLGRFVRRHRLAVAATLAALAVLAATALQWKFERDRARLAQQQAQREAEAASGVTDFLVGLFAELDPENHPGRELAARELLDLGRERLRGFDTARPELRARLELGLGEIYANAGMPEPAQALLQSADAALRAQPDSPAALRAATALARAYNLTRRDEEAFASAARAVALAEAGGGTQRRELAHALMVRGVAQQRLRRTDAAEADFARAETLFAALDSTAELAAVRHNRAWLAEYRGDLVTSLAHHEQAWSDKRQVLGEDHPSTLRSLHGRGKLLARLGRYAEAAAAFTDLAERTQRVHGPGTEPMARALGELAGAYQDLGDHARAQPYYERSLALYRQLADGGETLAVAFATNNLAALLESRGDAARAEALYRESLAMRERLLPEGDVSRTTPLHNLANLLFGEARLEAARELAERACAQREAGLQASHPLRLASAGLLARIAAAQGDAARARAVAAEFDAAAGDPDLPWNIRVERERLHAALAELDDDHDARFAALARADAELAAVLPAAHPRLARLRLDEAEALLAAGERDRAQRRAEEAGAVLRATLQSASPVLLRLEQLERGLRDGRH